MKDFLFLSSSTKCSVEEITLFLGGWSFYCVWVISARWALERTRAGWSNSAPLGAARVARHRNLGSPEIISHLPSAACLLARHGDGLNGDPSAQLGHSEQ